MEASPQACGPGRKESVDGEEEGTHEEAPEADDRSWWSGEEEAGQGRDGLVLNNLGCPKCKFSWQLTDKQLDDHLEWHDDKVACPSCGLAYDPDNPPSFREKRGSELTGIDHDDIIVRRGGGSTQASDAE
jgi:ssDNA-binding Zn-finger/Zn-ribbon topoisomerase 1